MTRPSRILVVDDNPALHEDFRKILTPGDVARAEALGALESELFGATSDRPTTLTFELDTAVQGREGLARVEAALAEQHPYAVAFVDMRMPPGWDGVETIEHLWAVDPTLQVVLCTAYSDYAWDDLVERLGENDRLVILKKPFDTVEARQLASALSMKWRLAREMTQLIETLQERVAERTHALAEAKDVAEHATRAKSTFLATMSHEIRTPINVVMGMAGILADSALADEQRRSVVAIQKSAAGLLALVEDILDLSRIEAEQLVLVAEAFDPRTVIDDVADLLGYQARGKGLALVSTIAPDVPARLMGDARRLGQVITNLVRNAIKFTERGTIRMLVDVAAVHDDSTVVRFVVEDTGIGIPPAMQAAIFESFTQVDPGTARAAAGTGLGLAICRQLVTLMHGTLAVRSVPGEGSAFSVEVPLRHA